MCVRIHSCKRVSKQAVNLWWGIGNDWQWWRPALEDDVSTRWDAVKDFDAYRAASDPSYTTCTPISNRSLAAISLPGTAAWREHVTKASAMAERGDAKPPPRRRRRKRQ